jgi:hypothetical protein
MNPLYVGDNLQWLRDTKEFPEASVDLVYFDPPFDSQRRLQLCQSGQFDPAAAKKGPAHEGAEREEGHGDDGMKETPLGVDTFFSR